MKLRSKLRKGKPLAGLTTFRIGGRARFYAEPPDEDDLRRILAYARARRMPVRVLGAGSNVLIPDKGVRGIVLRLSAPGFRKISLQGTRIQAGAGVALAELVRVSAAGGRGGLEFLAGIPGSVGGAVLMNAGAWGKNIAGCIEKISIMDYNGKIRGLSREDVSFGYRFSGLKECIVLGAAFKTRARPVPALRRRIADYGRKRRMTQHVPQPNAGCIFKNPPRLSAGRLIESCGLKGKRSGGALVSERHANFIVNAKQASAADVLRLMRLVKGKVRRVYGVELEPEIRVWKY
ncbi:MAG: UDP-N-acetylmuramate dehydrogenase [Candidatus Omnitrophica bacterium]|nr:UDP-N-acetylmuramate dehydrogenase [Candidatus Omnitrophota bacterium]